VISRAIPVEQIRDGFCIDRLLGGGPADSITDRLDVEAAIHAELENRVDGFVGSTEVVVSR